MRTEIRIAGFGGQGIGLAGYVIGKALAIHSESEAVMTQSYGPEARGGASSADIIVSSRNIDYPFIEEPDILIVLSQEAYTKFRPTSKESAKVLIDCGLVNPKGNDKTFKIPATELAEKLGNRIVANMVMLGFFSAITSIVGRESIEKTIGTTVKPQFLKLNLKAFETGFAYAEERCLIKESEINP
jgi:2-oxoglutarate ferredoxin oxidoreductase subunit gamma